MAEPSPSPDPSNPNPNPNPNPTPSDSQPNSIQPPSSTPPPPTAPPTLNPNPNPTTAPPFPPPQINPYTAAPSFRPAGAPPPMAVPQFTPIPQNPNMPVFPTQPNHVVPPPGVTTAPPQQQQMLPGQVGQPPLRPPFMPMPNGYMGTVPQGSLPPGVVRYPYPPIVRPPFLRPGVPIGTVPPLPRPFLGLRPPVIPPVVRPNMPLVILPAEKPQTTVYVGKIAPSVDNDFIRSLLELCGPIKSWKRAQDPSDGTLKRFGFCEFESAEGVLRALRLLSKCNVDGEELVLNVNQATREYLERYVKKKKENLNKPVEAGTEEAKKEGERTSEGEKGEVNEKKEPTEGSEESKKDLNETENEENDASSFGLVTDEDRDADRQALEKLNSMIEEFLKNKPPPPPPPPAHKDSDGTNNSNAELAAKSGDKDSDIDTAKNEEKNDDETTSETKATNRAGTVSPDRSRRYDNRNRDRERDRDRDRDRDRQVKERELDRLERERERERARREKEREFEIQKAERFYKERVKEWETREKEKEYERKREREKEKERERERRRLISEQEDESDDDSSRRRRRKSEVEDKRRRRKREKEEDLADRLKEEEELLEAKKRKEAEEKEEEKAEQQRQQEKQALDLPSIPLANGSELPILPEIAPSEIKDDVMEEDHDTDFVPPSHTGDDENVENGSTDEPMITSGSTSDIKSGNAPAKKLGFGLVGSGKRTTVPSVFHEEEDEEAQKDKKLRPLVPIDYSTEELQVGHVNEGEAPLVSAPASTDSGKRVNSKEAKADAERDRSTRRPHDRASHRDRGRERDGDEAPRSREILDAKQLIDMIPKTKDDLFSYEINWAVYDENRLHERMRPWISKKITEFLGEEETTLVEFIVDRFREHVKAEKMLDVLQRILDEEAEMFVLKMWRMLIFEIKRVETGLIAKPGA